MSQNCKRATLRVHDELRRHGVPQRGSIETALVVYRYHHPEASLDRAIETVGGWLSNSGALDRPGDQ